MRQFTKSMDERYPMMGFISTKASRLQRAPQVHPLLLVPRAGPAIGNQVHLILADDCRVLLVLR
jgi:hypothetical protein